jgi:hypothetical protein
MGQGMTVREIAALMRRHLLAMAVVLMIAAGVTYSIMSTPPIYSESATVIFSAGPSLADSRLSASFMIPLIATEVMLSQTMMSSPAQSQVRAAGGTAAFELMPYNLYSLQYPDYGEPITMLTVTSSDPEAIQRTFGVVLGILGQRLAAMQAHVPPRNRVQDSLVGDSGMAAQPGSSVRVLAGLVLLTVIAVFTVANFLDRRQYRPGVPRPGGRGKRLAAGQA